jgi:putative oxidoreductase
MADALPTDGLAYLAALTLALVFAYSAVGKFRDAHPTRRALDAARLPAGRVIAKAVPVVELCTSLLLVMRPSTGAAVAVVLLTIFTLFLAYLLLRGIDVSCGCFGAKASSSVSSIDLVRNVFLFVLAAAAVSISRPSAVTLEDLMVATTTIAIGVVFLTAMSTRRTLGQLFDNRLPGER